MNEIITENKSLMQKLYDIMQMRKMHLINGGRN